MLNFGRLGRLGRFVSWLVRWLGRFVGWLGWRRCKNVLYAPADRPYLQLEI